MNVIIIIVYYVYVLKSTVSRRFYVGYSSDLRRRLKEHNEGRSRSDKGYSPWELVYYEAYRDKSVATKREKQLKNHAAKNEVLTRLGFEAK